MELNIKKLINISINIEGGKICQKKENNIPIKKVKLNYMSAVSHAPPKVKIAVSSAKMEKELDRAIKEKD